MTTDELKEQVIELVTDYVANIDTKVNHLLASGCISLDNYESDDCLLAKAICYNLALDFAHQVKPLSDKGLEEAENISKFI